MLRECLTVEIALDEAGDEAAERGGDEGGRNDEDDADDAFPRDGEGEDEVDEDGNPGSDDPCADGPWLFASACATVMKPAMNGPRNRKEKLIEDGAALVVVDSRRGRG